MAALTVVSGTLQSAVAATTSSPTGGSTLPSIPITSYLVATSIKNPIVPITKNITNSGLQVSDSNTARGFSTTVKYGQIYPRNVYGS